MVCAQSDGLLQLNDPIHHFLIRQQTAGFIPSAHLTHLPLSAYEARQYLDSLDVERLYLSFQDRELLDIYRGVQDHPGAYWGQKRSGWMFANGRDFYATKDEDYSFQINPLLYYSLGYAARNGGQSSRAWRTTRGFRFSGSAGKYLFFEGRLSENQRQLDRVNAERTVPRKGFVNVAGNGALDWFESIGIIGLRTRLFEVRFGRDTNRWGSGLNSATLSNYASPYDQLELRATLGKVQYVSLMAGFAGPRSSTGQHLRLRKYASIHRLSVKLPHRIEASVFEAVVFATDSLGQRRSFDLSYANPIIFLRAAERDRGSPDNAMVGLGASWIHHPGLKLYGQLLLDELSVSQIGKQWWANKWAWILGAHSEDIFAENLSMRFEVSRLRPFIYSHDTELEAYVHHGDLLGHPVGPNAWDLTVSADYLISPRWNAATVASFTKRGINDGTTNFGSDPRVSYNTRAGDFNQFILQGIRQNEVRLEAYLGYEVLPDVHLDASFGFHSINDDLNGLDRSATLLLQLRWGVPFEFARY